VRVVKKSTATRRRDGEENVAKAVVEKTTSALSG
jgi:hypothetical protein